MAQSDKREATRQTPFDLETIIALIQNQTRTIFFENDECLLARAKDGSLISFDKERLTLKVDFSESALKKDETSPPDTISFAEYLDWYDAQTNE